MPTPIVPWFPESSCHITARGNRKSEIFRDKEDLKHYLMLMEEALKYFEYDEFEIFCYCLMSNHIHMLIKTKDKAPGQFIGRIHARYAKYFNRKYDYIGHLFQGRYHGEFIKSNRQMLETSRYIHLNPVKANMVQWPEEYEWSSYNMYIGLKKENLISSSKILDYFEMESREKLYRDYVESAMENKDGVEEREFGISV